MKPIVLVLGLCAYGLIYSFWLSGYVLSKDIGTTAMRAVSDPIREGAEGFLKVQYSAVFRMAALLSVLIYLSYYLRPSAGPEDSVQGVSLLSNSYLGTLCAASFITGASCSAAAGYLAMCRLLIFYLVVFMTSALTLIDTIFVSFPLTRGGCTYQHSCLERRAAIILRSFSHMLSRRSL